MEETLKVLHEADKNLKVLNSILDVCLEYRKGADAEVCMNTIDEIISILSKQEN